MCTNYVLTLLKTLTYRYFGIKRWFVEVLPTIGSSNRGYLFCIYQMHFCSFTMVVVVSYVFVSRCFFISVQRILFFKNLVCVSGYFLCSHMYFLFPQMYLVCSHMYFLCSHVYFLVLTCILFVFTCIFCVLAWIFCFLTCIFFVLTCILFVLACIFCVRICIFCVLTYIFCVLLWILYFLLCCPFYFLLCKDTVGAACVECLTIFYLSACLVWFFWIIEMIHTFSSHLGMPISIFKSLNHNTN